MSFVTCVRSLQRSLLDHVHFLADILSSGTMRSIPKQIRVQILEAVLFPNIPKINQYTNNFHGSNLTFTNWACAFDEGGKIWITIKNHYYAKTVILYARYATQNKTLAITLNWYVLLLTDSSYMPCSDEALPWVLGFNFKIWARKRDLQRWHHLKCITTSRKLQM